MQIFTCVVILSCVMWLSRQPCIPEAAFIIEQFAIESKWNKNRELFDIQTWIYLGNISAQCNAICIYVWEVIIQFSTSVGD